jgi:hypothetical protein
MLYKKMAGRTFPKIRFAVSYARMRPHGTNWKDDPSWRMEISDTHKEVAVESLKQFIANSKQVSTSSDK